jgi:hypothetical protein
VAALVTVLGFGVLVVVAQLFGLVIEWFGYRRHGWPIDRRSLGVGFVAAGAIALLVTLVTDGPWIVALAFASVGAIYLVRARIES